MTLDPARYKCPEHDVDGTDRVKEKLDRGRPDVAFRRPLFGMKSPGPEPFQVIVTCPGAEAEQAHLYRHQFSIRARTTQAATVLLILAALLAGATAAATLLLTRR